MSMLANRFAVSSPTSFFAVYKSQNSPLINDFSNRDGVGMTEHRPDAVTRQKLR